MKVELQCGDTITIPEGCKAIVKDGSVVFEKEEKEEKEEVQEFKDGDVLCSKTDDTMLIFKEVCNHDREVFDSHYNTSRRDDKRWNINAFRHAYEEEKSHFLDQMKEQGLQWNAEAKRVEKIRWRAKKDGDYYFIDINLTVKSIDDTYSTFDNGLWDALNYFRTEEQAEEAAKRMKEVLHKYHEEIGE